MMASPPGIILTAPLFAELDHALIALLQSLEPADWRRPTIVPGWHVQQVAAHLLDTALRRLSVCRDGWHIPGPAPQSAADLVDLVNRMNAAGARVFGALSPRLLVALTESVAPQLAEYFSRLDPMAPAAFAVSWAGESTSANWFDIAREYTERWHHQQQIRLATDRPGIMTARLYGPVLATFMRALPHTYRACEAPDGARLDVLVEGDGGGRWQMTRTEGQWQLVVPDGDGVADATVVVPAELAWRVFTKGLSRDEAASRIAIRGDTRLGAVFFGARAIVG